MVSSIQGLVFEVLVGGIYGGDIDQWDFYRVFGEDSFCISFCIAFYWYFGGDDNGFPVGKGY